MADGTGDDRLRVLITNRVLHTRTGTELYVRDLAIELLRRGHLPIVYSPALGDVAEEIRAATVPVVDDLAQIATPPDIVHGHHGPETLAALLAFPGVPGMHVCHSWVGYPDAPVVVPRVRRYVAVDVTCRDRLVLEHGIADERVHVHLNAVDLTRFPARGPLPPRPRRALVFGNNVNGRTPYDRAIRRACETAGIAVELAGRGSGRVLARPQEVLGDYDLVFAKGRTALEAAAVGASVVLGDPALGFGPMITTGNFRALRPLNFGMRALGTPPSADVVTRELARYDPADAATVSRLVRETASHVTLVDDLVSLYREVIAEQRAAPGDPQAELRAAGRYLQAWPNRCGSAISCAGWSSASSECRSWAGRCGGGRAACRRATRCPSCSARLAAWSSQRVKRIQPSAPTRHPSADSCPCSRSRNRWATRFWPRPMRAARTSDRPAA
jgi:hypothetical protein